MSFIVGYETWEIVGLNESLEVTKFGFQWVYEIVQSMRTSGKPFGRNSSRLPLIAIWPANVIPDEPDQSRSQMKKNRYRS